MTNSKPDYMTLPVYTPCKKGDMWPLPYHVRGAWLLVLSDSIQDEILADVIPAWKAIFLKITALGPWYADRLNKRDKAPQEVKQESTPGGTRGAEPPQSGGKP
jgi:hypothetical protein